MPIAATAELLARVSRLPRVALATLPTPLERGPELPGGARLWVKRDDLTGLGAGGNKARKLEFLCGEAVEGGAGALVTVGAGQSNHCRMTAAAAAILGLDAHLVMSGERPDRLAGNQLLAELFGAQLHFAGCPANHWGELEIARERVTADLAGDGAVPHSIPLGGSTAVGAVGYVVGFVELLDQLAAQAIVPKAVVFTSSSGGTHAGLVAGRALARAARTAGVGPLPDLVAVGVAKGVLAGQPSVADLAADAIGLLGFDAHRAQSLVDDDGPPEVDDRWLGDDYAVPSAAGDEAMRWAARRGGWVLDRTYTGKGFAGLLGNDADGRWGPGDDVVFVHTGGSPAVFTTDGTP